mmetsp:Transcript_224/g.532  ORF Transcript_224/g.532 Transcript_224/m.532 type:complete len:251 (-) Transcript_224:446-1198(-)
MMSFALANAPQMELSFSDAFLKRLTIQRMISPTPSEKSLMRDERRRHRQAFIATSLIAPRAFRSKFWIASDTFDTSSENSRTALNISWQTSPLERRQSNANFPELMTVKRLTFSTSVTRLLSSLVWVSTSGRSGSPSFAPFSAARPNLSSMQSSMKSGRESIPSSMASIISSDFSTHFNARSPSSPANFVASLIRSPSTKSRITSNLLASNVPSADSPSSVSFNSSPNATTSAALSTVSMQRVDVSREEV